MNKKHEKELIDQVRAKFGVPMPQWRVCDKDGDVRAHRIFSREEKLEMDKLVDWLVWDEEYLRHFQIYLHYADILKYRGYASKKDVVFDKDWLTWQQRVMKNFARCQVEYVYHDMCCDPATVLGQGNADGYWIYLDHEYLDISHMKVGNAILNLDEIWEVVSVTLREWVDKCISREVNQQKHSCYTCDRCGKAIYDKTGCRFDVYENLLHCKTCAATCDHWKRIDRKGPKRV